MRHAISTNLRERDRDRLVARARGRLALLELG
jgi:hypothetical protein